MDNLIEVIRNNLVSDKDISHHLRTRGVEYDEVRPQKGLVSEFTEKGWEIHQEKKKISILRKSKSHDRAFEDRVWTAFAKMGFTYLNTNKFKLPYTKDEKIPGKQIDVFAADEETIIVVECKSSEEIKKRHLQVYINEFITVREGSASLLKSLFSEKHKIKYIFATNNVVLSKNDRQRLKEAKIIHFNQDDISYYEELIRRIGKAARYQLLGRIFKGQEIPGMDFKIPAVRGKMGGHNYYSFSTEPDKLLKVGYILHRINTQEEDDGYQRMISRNRLKEIEKFINSGGCFPNSIIININTRKEQPLNFDKLSAEHHSNISEPVILHLPKKYHSAFIIDGQHRLYGYANTEWKHKNSVPVVAFENLPPEDQVELFVKINSKQKPVAKNLITTIISDIMWNSDKYGEALQALKSKLLVTLGKRDDSPFYRRIVVGDNARSELTCITLDTVLTYGFNKTKFFAKVNKGKLVDLGHLWVDPATDEGFEYKPMLEKSYEFFATLFDYIKEKTGKVWNLGSSSGGFVAMNIGVVSLIRVADNIVDHINKYEGVDPGLKGGEELAALTFNYLDPVLDYVNSLDDQGVAQFRKLGASAAGVENAVRELQKIINEKQGKFKPEGLEQWIKDTSGRFNEYAKKFTELIELGIRENVIGVLQSEEAYGEKWWIQGVPPDIQKSAASKRIDQKSEEPDHNFLDLLDYKKIISRNWALFKAIYADPQFKSNKDNQLKWFDRLNEIRNKVAHPSRAKVTEDENKFLLYVNGWLPLLISVDKISE